MAWGHQLNRGQIAAIKEEDKQKGGLYPQVMHGTPTAPRVQGPARPAGPKPMLPKLPGLPKIGNSRGVHPFKQRRFYGE